MNIEDYETIWFPGIYHGRPQDEWLQKVSDVELDDIIERVQRRAKEDGEWAIDNGMVGENNENEPKMRKMMGWVSREDNIRQAVDTYIREGRDNEVTIDYVCRDLANASKWVGGHSE